MTTASSSTRRPFSSRLGQPSAGRLDAIGRSLSKSYSFHISTQPLQQQNESNIDDGALNVDTIPIDFQLKTKIRISSPKALDWLTNQDAKILYRSMEIFMKRELLPPFSQLDDADSAAVFRASLLSWIHPDNSFEEFNIERRARWEQSFHSIYYVFRQGKADYFYVIGAKFAVLFANGIAIISRSTSEIRKELATNGVEFSMPLMKTRADDERIVVDVTEESALLIEGRRDLHRLFEYLINKKFLGDVPTIVSHIPFINASIRSAIPVYNQVTSAPVKAPTLDGPKLIQSHVVEFSGILLPTEAGVIADLLRQRINCPITMQVWSEPLTAAMDRIGGRDLADVACKNGFLALMDVARKHLEADPTMLIKTLRFARTGKIAVDIEPASKPSSLSRALSSTKII